MASREDAGARAGPAPSEAEVVRARRARDIFDRALDRADEAVRGAFVTEACGGDAALEAEVRALLASLRQAETSHLFPALARAAEGAAAGAMASATASPRAGASSGTGPADLSGRVTGNFRLGRKLGQGGMGAVYEARHLVLGRPAAVKVLHAHLAGDEPNVRRFLNEARAVNAIRHPHIVEVADAGTMDEGRGPPYIVMERLEGESLGRRLGRVGALPIAEAGRIGLQVAEALAAAHAAGVVHRDLKPENIFLCAGADSVKVLDFGIAKLRGAALAAGPTTTGGALLGTPQYMAPEQWRGQSLVDERTDVHALGLVLCEMLTGRPAFSAGNWAELFERQVSGSPALLPGVPLALAGVVHQALAAKPDDRHPTMRAFAAALTEALERGDARAASPGSDAGRRHSKIVPMIVPILAVTVLAAGAVWVLGTRVERPSHGGAASRPTGHALAAPTNTASRTAAGAGPGATAGAIPAAAPWPARAHGSPEPPAPAGSSSPAIIAAANVRPAARAVAPPRRRAPRRWTAHHNTSTTSTGPATPDVRDEGEAVVPSFLRQNPYQ